MAHTVAYASNVSEQNRPARAKGIWHIFHYGIIPLPSFGRGFLEVTMKTYDQQIDDGDDETDDEADEVDDDDIEDENESGSQDGDDIEDDLDD